MPIRPGRTHRDFQANFLCPNLEPILYESHTIQGQLRTWCKILTGRDLKDKTKQIYRMIPLKRVRAIWRGMWMEISTTCRNWPVRLTYRSKSRAGIRAREMRPLLEVTVWTTTMSSALVEETLLADSSRRTQSRCNSSSVPTRTKLSDSQLIKRFRTYSKWRVGLRAVLARVCIKASKVWHNQQVKLKLLEIKLLSEYRAGTTKTSKIITGGWTLLRVTWTPLPIRPMPRTRATWPNSIKQCMRQTRRRTNLINNSKCSSTWPCKRR